MALLSWSTPAATCKAVESSCTDCLVCGSQALHPSLCATATHTASSDNRSPTVRSDGMAHSQQQLCTTVSAAVVPQIRPLADIVHSKYSFTYLLTVETGKAGLDSFVVCV